MDEAMIQALIEMGAIPEEQAMLLRQANQGQQMMQTPGATGQNVAGTYVAANPVEHLSVALQRIMGGQQQKTAEQGYRDTLGKQTAGRKTYADALLQQILGGQQQPPQPVTEMPTMWIGDPQGDRTAMYQKLIDQAQRGQPGVTEMPPMYIGG